MHQQRRRSPDVLLGPRQQDLEVRVQSTIAFANPTVRSAWGAGHVNDPPGDGAPYSHDCTRPKKRNATRESSLVRSGGG
eukprot:1954547-Alexandrium_andersonii.AAC.1